MVVIAASGRLSTRTVQRRWLARLVVAGGLAGFVGVTYLVLVLGGGAFVGHTASPDRGLSILATVVVALGFDRVRSALSEWADAALLDGKPTPYDVLRQFSTTITGSASSEEVPQRMAKVLCEGTSASWAQVWLIVHETTRLAASWPAHAVADGLAPPQTSAGVVTREVRESGELLGHLRISPRPDAALGPVEQRLFADLSQQAGLALRGARLHAELVEQAMTLSAQEIELRRSRERLVDAHDTGRRRLERDIHDGAQQHLVALAVNLRLAQSLAGRAPDRADQVLAEQERAVGTAVTTLLDLSRGIYPRALTEQGLTAALRDAVATSPQTIELSVQGVGRLATGMEAALYFCAVEALQNTAKHAGAQHVSVTVTARDQDLVVLTVKDDGRGFDTDGVEQGTGLANMRDRIESVGGALVVDCVPGSGTTVTATVPAPPLPERAG